MKKLKKNENSKSWNTYYELAGSCACGICSCSCTSTSDASLTGMRSNQLTKQVIVRVSMLFIKQSSLERRADVSKIFC